MKVGFKFYILHSAFYISHTSSTFNRCVSLRTIPSICGVASTSFTELVLFKPKAFSVFFCRSGLSIGLLTNVIFIFFIAPSNSPPSGGESF